MSNSWPRLGETHNGVSDSSAASRRSCGQGWGLLQVLLTMNPVEPGAAALNEFARAAEVVLTRRIANSPIERQESKWLPGWRARLDTYRPQNLLAGY